MAESWFSVLHLWRSPQCSAASEDPREKATQSNSEGGETEGPCAERGRPAPPSIPLSLLEPRCPKTEGANETAFDFPQVADRSGPHTLPPSLFLLESLREPLSGLLEGQKKKKKKDDGPLNPFSESVMS